MFSIGFNTRRLPLEFDYPTIAKPDASHSSPTTRRFPSPREPVSPTFAHRIQMTPTDTIINNFTICVSWKSTGTSLERIKERNHTHTPLDAHQENQLKFEGDKVLDQWRNVSFQIFRMVEDMEMFFQFPWGNVSFKETQKVFTALQKCNVLYKIDESEEEKRMYSGEDFEDMRGNIYDKFFELDGRKRKNEEDETISPQLPKLPTKKRRLISPQPNPEFTDETSQESSQQVPSTTTPQTNQDNSTSSAPNRVSQAHNDAKLDELTKDVKEIKTEIKLIKNNQHLIVTLLGEIKEQNNCDLMDEFKEADSALEFKEKEKKRQEMKKRKVDEEMKKRNVDEEMKKKMKERKERLMVLVKRRKVAELATKLTKKKELTKKKKAEMTTKDGVEEDEDEEEGEEEEEEDEEIAKNLDLRPMPHDEEDKEKEEEEEEKDEDMAKKEKTEEEKEKTKENIEKEKEKTEEEKEKEKTEENIEKENEKTKEEKEKIVEKEKTN
ncbi:golgin subfamily A member 6-like protein 22 [Impatiens glandulifera]|uniref:golgin subfamily A member 6-like protein 22 n=1 Tax=Impatiens glandulifera TaxID=253017 RepID=UPI001FB07437|nr:golgin subfamily A member 6-like protein 22 [Impatiens glandulifera]